MKSISDEALKQILDSSSSTTDNDDQDVNLAQMFNDLDLSEEELADFIKQLESDIDYLVDPRKKI